MRHTAGKCEGVSLVQIEKKSGLEQLNLNFGSFKGYLLRECQHRQICGNPLLIYCYCGFLKLSYYDQVQNIALFYFKKQTFY